MSYLNELFDLDEKIAIVTGASRGIGRGAAVALASAGATVICVGRDREALSETIDLMPAGRGHILEADVTHPEQVINAVDATLRQHGQIDILVNNAGIIRRAAAIDYSGEDWNNVIDTNLNAVFGWSQAVGKSMIERGSGKIINVASLLSFTGGINVAAYAAAKGGVAQLTKALSNEWAKYNVQVNAIAPGYIITDATAALRNNAERSKQLLSRIPAGRWGEPEDLAGAFLFLASDASDYVNGHILTVDGGYLAY
jgi:2-dehydro-3-deoxy-D-gluconate 5-dehydrogenase